MISSFRLGTPVSLTDAYGCVSPGASGIVRGVDPITGFVAVEFPAAFPGGTSCKTPSGLRLTRDGHGAWLPSRLLRQTP